LVAELENVGFDYRKVGWRGKKRGTFSTQKTDKGRMQRQQALIDRLIAILEGHLENHRQLLSVMGQKMRAMIDGHTDEFREIARLERVALERIALSDVERIVAIDTVGQALGFTKMRLLDLITISGEEHREALLDLRDDLRDIREEQELLKRFTQKLILRSLEQLFTYLGCAKLEKRNFIDSAAISDN